MIEDHRVRSGALDDALNPSPFAYVEKRLRR
jgi:hypothetical protein